MTIPQHVGIIMDGNGRWAAARGKTRFEGHKAGVAAIERTLTAARDAGVGFLTLYAFSTENWRRPPAEVADLMGLLRWYLANKVKALHEQNICLKIIGNHNHLSDDIKASLEDAETKTAHNTALTLSIALSYGGRDELVRAINKIIKEQQVTEESISNALDTAGLPDPDLIIRTSGEQRLSNFLLWQAAYSEYVWCDEHWPDFNEEIFNRCLAEFATRKRRYGQVV